MVPNRLRHIVQQWPAARKALVISFTGVFLVAIIQATKPFYYDSGNYWLLGEGFVRHGDFSLLNFNSPLRGYLLPLMDRELHALSSALKWTPSGIVKLFNAFIFVLIGTVLAPRLAELAWPERPWGTKRRLALMVPLVIFWRGYLNFPLSDFVALAMVLVALIAAARADSPGWMLVTGLALGAAIDVRPSYTPLLLIIPILIAQQWFEKRHCQISTITGRMLGIGLLLIGLFAVSLPQSFVSHRYYNTWSFVPGTSAQLDRLQLTIGLRTQRYETFVGPSHGPRMFYGDEAGRKLIAEQPRATIAGTGQYLRLIVDHPLTMSSIFFRHVVNGLDQRYSTPYVEHLDDGSHRWLRLTGFLLVFLALLRVLWPSARRRLGRARWRYPAALLLCCITSIPSAMETRFLLPVYLLSYILVLTTDWPSPIASREAGLLRFRMVGLIVIAYLAFMAVIWHVTTTATAQLTFV